MPDRQNDFDITAEYYDLFELKSKGMYAGILNLLDGLFKGQGVRSVLDMTCGTGAQAFGLAERGYDVTACDISEEMLAVAKRKAVGTAVSFHHGNIRTSWFGAFDAVIAISSIPYLGRDGFQRALGNVSKNLKPGGLFVFDSTNPDFVRSGRFSTERRIDAAGDHEGTKFVRFTQSEVDLDQGTLTIHWEAYVQQSHASPMKQFAGTWVRQLYAIEELRQLLAAAGFEVLKLFDRDGKEFGGSDSFAVVVAARKS